MAHITHAYIDLVLSVNRDSTVQDFAHKFHIVGPTLRRAQELTRIADTFSHEVVHEGVVGRKNGLVCQELSQSVILLLGSFGVPNVIQSPFYVYGGKPFGGVEPAGGTCAC